MTIDSDLPAHTPLRPLTLSRHQHEWALRESFRRGTINDVGSNKLREELATMDNGILGLQREWNGDLGVRVWRRRASADMFAGARIRKAFLWLNPRYVYTRESTVLREKNYTGTCDWIERKLEFRQFMQSTASGNMWIRGGPGCGVRTLPTMGGKY